VVFEKRTENFFLAHNFFSKSSCIEKNIQELLKNSE